MGYRRKTRPGRLRHLDRMLFALEPEVFSVGGPFEGAPIVDLGIGAQPWTSLEWADAHPELEFVAIDIAPDVVERAQVHQRPNLTFQVGSFDLLDRPARLVRALNVCRDLTLAEVPDAHRRMGEGVLPGGVVVEGSCAPEGEAGTVHLLRSTPTGLHRESLLMWLDGTRGRSPLVFRDRLPRDLRSDRSHPIHEALKQWGRRYGEVEPGPQRAMRARVHEGIEVVIQDTDGLIGFRWKDVDTPVRLRSSSAGEEGS